MDTRPELDPTISEQDFKDFYWLKEELVAFCRSVGINPTGNKTTLEERISSFLQSGELKKTVRAKSSEPTSNFDWRKEKLTADTVLTDSYKNNQNVRGFFAEYIGKRFRFNIIFMDWIKMNYGKTLADAAEAWLQIEAEQKSRTKPKEILPHLQYNRYIRDFLAGNPDKSMQDAIHYWKIKKNKRGDNLYCREDLE
ncbi:MAG: DUF6434 domain-containing protein [Calditrichia bacterium]